MKFIMDVPACDVMTAEQYGKVIAANMGWIIEEDGPNTPANGFRFREKIGKGRSGDYDPVNDEIRWDGDEYSSLFDCDSPDWYGESADEMLDATWTVWGENEGGETVLYVHN